jgi:hypothetical protein
MGLGSQIVPEYLGHLSRRTSLQKAESINDHENDSSHNISPCEQLAGYISRPPMAESRIFFHDPERKKILFIELDLREKSF